MGQNIATVDLGDLQKACEAADDLLSKAGYSSGGFQQNPKNPGEKKGGTKNTGTKAKVDHEGGEGEEQDEGEDGRKSKSDHVAGTKTNKSEAASDDEEGTEEETDKSLDDHPDVKKAVEVSAFLAGLTNQMDSCLTALRVGLGGRMEGMAKALSLQNVILKGVLESYGEQAGIIKGLHDRLDQLERQPVGRKAIQKSIPMPGQPMLPTGNPVIFERNFLPPAGGEPSGMTRGEIKQRLEDWAMKGELDMIQLSKFEHTGELSHELQRRLGLAG